MFKIKESKSKPKVGFFNITSCAGCQFNLLFISYDLVKLIEKLDITYFPMVRENSNSDGPFDIAFIEGSVTKKEEIKKVKEIRKKSKLVIAFGTCATYGGVPSIKNFLDLNIIEEKIYLAPHAVRTLKTADGIDKYIKVDYYLRGCPFDKQEFLRIITELLVGKIPKEVEQPVCVECRERYNVCLLQQGLPCMGPITHGGCEAVCTGDGTPCVGCRGPIPDLNLDAQVELFKKMGMTKKDILSLFRTFSGSSKAYMAFGEKGIKKWQKQ